MQATHTTHVNILRALSCCIQFWCCLLKQFAVLQEPSAEGVPWNTFDVHEWYEAEFALKVCGKGSGAEQAAERQQGLMSRPGTA